MYTLILLLTTLLTTTLALPLAVSQGMNCFKPDLCLADVGPGQEDPWNDPRPKPKPKLVDDDKRDDENDLILDRRGDEMVDEAVDESGMAGVCTPPEMIGSVDGRTELIAYRFIYAPPPPGPGPAPTQRCPPAAHHQTALLSRPSRRPARLVRIPGFTASSTRTFYLPLILQSPSPHISISACVLTDFDLRNALCTSLTSDFSDALGLHYPGSPDLRTTQKGDFNGRVLSYQCFEHDENSVVDEATRGMVVGEQ